MTEPTRREFLQKAATGLGAAAMALAGADAVAQPPGLRPQEAGVPPGYDWTEHDYVLLIDTTKCIGCGSCVRACAAENDVPEHYFRTWVERYMISSTGEVHVDSPEGGKNGFPVVQTGQDVTKAFFVAKVCNHCRFTPCVQLCPVGASYRTLDGLVLVDERRCIGCGYCVQGCPYGTRFMHPVTHVASKCTLCYHRISRGMLPACVEVCPAGARLLGDTKRPGDPVVRRIRTERVDVLQPELLTHPRCYYAGLDGEVI